MRPLVGVICCTRGADDPVQGVAERYLRAAPFFEADVVLIPSMPDVIDPAAIVARLDGVLLTGSPSNVRPSLYGAPGPGVGPFDPARDAMSAALIRECLAQDKPLLAICRGFQEVAVALGATLRHDLGEAARPLRHHAPAHVPMPDQFAHRHSVHLAPSGVLACALGTLAAEVNSVHYQGVDRLGVQLTIEAASTDGVVEAVRPACGARILAVQWHPEWGTAADPTSQAIFGMFAHMLRGATMWRAAQAVAGTSIGASFARSAAAV